LTPVYKKWYYLYTERLKRMELFMKSKAEKVISLRVSGDWVNLLEKLGKKWDTKVLSFYFLSSFNEEKWKSLEYQREVLLQLKGEPVAIEHHLQALNFFFKEAREYMEFLEELTGDIASNVERVKGEMKWVNSITQEKQREYLEVLSRATETNPPLLALLEEAGKG